eukprot:scaffold463_cov341-Pavlova_lutheri.AAC.4
MWLYVFRSKGGVRPPSPNATQGRPMPPSTLCPGILRLLARGPIFIVSKATTATQAPQSDRDAEQLLGLKTTTPPCFGG